MMVDGKAIPLGIPGRGTGPTSVSAVADIPLKRAGTAAEAAGGILLMCCPYSSYITGHTLVVTGVSHRVILGLNETLTIYRVEEFKLDTADDMGRLAYVRLENTIVNKFDVTVVPVARGPAIQALILN